MTYISYVALCCGSLIFFGEWVYEAPGSADVLVGRNRDVAKSADGDVGVPREYVLRD